MIDVVKKKLPIYIFIRTNCFQNQPMEPKEDTIEQRHCGIKTIHRPYFSGLCNIVSNSLVVTGLLK